MAVVKAISTQELAALANRLRLTLIRDRMVEIYSSAASDVYKRQFLQYGRWKILILRLNHQLM